MNKDLKKMSVFLKHIFNSKNWKNEVYLKGLQHGMHKLCTDWHELKTCSMYDRTKMVPVLNTIQS